MANTDRRRISKRITATDGALPPDVLARVAEFFPKDATPAQPTGVSQRRRWFRRFFGGS
ncbi:MAG: hypothetical protein HOV78_22045 [Hamadaea sp.]|nr:hypothetical protein [Hamadaea sp.]